MNRICQALAFLFAFLVLAPAPRYDVEPVPAAHPMTLAHTRLTP